MHRSTKGPSLRPTSAVAMAAVTLSVLRGSCRASIAPLGCTAPLAVGEWTCLGSSRERITAVAVTDGGLLVRTHNQGVSGYNSCTRVWDRLGLAGRDITSITELPAPSRRIIATAAPYQPPDGSTPDTISAVAYASGDGGRTWYARDGGLSAQLGYRGYGLSLAHDGADPSRFFVSVLGSVVRSTDGGATWSKRLRALALRASKLVAVSDELIINYPSVHNVLGVNASGG